MKSTKTLYLLTKWILAISSSKVDWPSLHSVVPITRGLLQIFVNSMDD